MQSEKRNVPTSKNAKDYLSKNEIPQLFECLMTGLMYHRPSDHIAYLEECLGRIKKQGVNGVRWDMFLEAKKTPLPPIESAPKEDYRPQPLPEIGNLQLRIAADATIIIIQSGPGIDKSSMCRQLCDSFPSFVHIQLGSILRDRALLEAQDDESRWRNVKDVINDGELVPEDFVIETLIKELNKYDETNNFLLEGYPRTIKQRQDFERYIGFGRVKFMVLVDCEEDVCHKMLVERPPVDGWSDNSQPAISKRLLNYKMKALPTFKYFDDLNKLIAIDGDRERDLVMKDIYQIFTKELNEPILPHPPSSPRVPEHSNVVKSGRESVASPVQVRHTSPVEDTINEPAQVDRPVPEPVTEIVQLTGIHPEEDRNPELPQCPFILVLGGPGSGKSDAIASACSSHPSWFHVDVNEIIRSNVIDSGTPDTGVATSEYNLPFVENWWIDIHVLKEAIKSVPDGTDVVILEGFPKDAEQLNQYNTEIGRADLVVLIDSEEEVMRARLAERYCNIQRAEDDEINSDMRIAYFTSNGLSLCRYYDERNRLCIVAGDRDLADVAADFEKIATDKLQIVDNTAVVEETADLPGTDKPIDDDVATAAATTIQASLRGHLARKKLKNMSQSNLEKNAVEEDKEVDENIILDNDEKVEVDQVEETEEAVAEELVVEIVAEQNAEEKEEEIVEESQPEIEAEENAEEKAEEVVEEPEPEIEAEENAEEKAEVVVDEPIAENEEEKIDTEDVIQPVTDVPLGVRTNSQLELKEAHVVLLLGGPGSGKNTVGSHIVSKFAIPIIHVDQIVASAIELESVDSEEFRKYLANEECDETPVYAMIRKAFMNSLGPSKVLFVTGFPKTVDQLQRFNIEVCSIAATIFLDVDEETLKTRLSESELPSDYADQLELFKNNSPLLIEELSKGDLFSKIDATQDRDTVLQEVTEIVENFHFMKSDSEE